MYLPERTKKLFEKYLPKKAIEKLYLWDTIIEKDLLKLLANSKIISADASYNNYGEFIFITFCFGKDAYFAWGLGIHESRQKVYDKTWRLDLGNYFPKYEDEKGMYIGDVKKAIEERRAEVDFTVEPTNESEQFNLIADMADDDFAYSEMYM